jgi:cell division protein FtsZ
MHAANIRVIGLGGAGNNAVNRMIESGLDGVEFIAANTDAQVLQKSHAELRIQLGDRLTRGLGAGANPDIGEKAALENADQIKETLEGADMVFITAGMGGGTGTGSAPVVAEVARALGILTVAIVTRPFRMEGPGRSRSAEEGIRKLSERVDGLIIVNNEKLLGSLDKKATLKDAFLVADRVLYYGIKGITGVINTSGMINLDFADVRNLLTGAGTVLMGMGAGRGEKMVEDVAMTAVHSPLLERDIQGAQKMLINVTGSADIVTLYDANEISAKICAATGVEAPDVLFGVTFDESAGDEVRVTLIATGFNDVPNLSTRFGAVGAGLGNLGTTNAGTARPSTLNPNLSRASVESRYDPNDYEIPAFLRRKD